MKGLNKRYKIPKVKRISVDEVYVRKHSKFKGESRNKKFFTIVSDLDRKRVLWVTEGRSKESLDEFFYKIGDKACKRIKVVAGDQFEGYYRSVKENCPKATFIWDRFHLVRNFTDALNEERKRIHGLYTKGSEVKKRTAGRYRYLFIKKASRRNVSEDKHVEYLLEKNEEITWLEIIKEKMYSLFDHSNENDCWDDLMEMRTWINKHGFEHLRKWLLKFIEGWDTFKNYFKYKVTSALSEGMNNIIKALIKRGYGYKNMEYLKLKILQQAGYLNSNYFDKNGVFKLM